MKLPTPWVHVKANFWINLENVRYAGDDFQNKGFEKRPELCGFISSCICLGSVNMSRLPYRAPARKARTTSKPGNAPSRQPTLKTL